MEKKKKLVSKKLIKKKTVFSENGAAIVLSFPPPPPPPLSSLSLLIRYPHKAETLTEGRVGSRKSVSYLQVVQGVLIRNQHLDFDIRTSEL